MIVIERYNFNCILCIVDFSIIFGWRVIMQRSIISVSSITYAIKGRDLLRKHGLRAYIERKTNANGNSGCGYVIVADGNREKISNALMNSGIKILQISSIA